jgi:hypothetical protein
LEYTRTVVGTSSPLYHLDQLYTQVLSHAFPDISPFLSGQVKKVLGTIGLLRNPLSSLALERLLGLKPRTVWRTLSRLHSIVIVPEDGLQVIRLVHPSFFDYMTNPARCLNSKFAVDAGSQNTLLARVCLDVMKGLRRDICGINDPSILNSEVGDLPARIKTHIPPELQYACRHWAWHVSNGMVSEILNSLEEFCSKYLLYWVEVCSLLGDLRGALVGLDEVQKALIVSFLTSYQATMLILFCRKRGARQRMPYHYSVIASASPLIFSQSSALVLFTYITRRYCSLRKKH